MAFLPQSKKSPLDYGSIRAYLDRINYRGALLDLMELKENPMGEIAPAHKQAAVSSLSMNLLATVKEGKHLETPIQLNENEIALANVLDE